ncbi:hypothetical protein [Curtobacterium oceanosedimentum]|uniref:hypothetical protein n=1 Tax=Curtobacterium oceanosedimentum TaxID=465820 RepID=UPI001379BF63|nr:hypothetical protein [Curtobacterium oceanosedimentum]
MGRQIGVRQTDLHEVRERGERPEVFAIEPTPQQELADAERVAELLTVHGWIAADHQRTVPFGSSIGRTTSHRNTHEKRLLSMDERKKTSCMSELQSDAEKYDQSNSFADAIPGR